jgi:hypothetical protein
VNKPEVKMKVFVLLLALMGFINSGSAISAESLRVEIEFRSQMFELEIAIITQASNISSNIRSRVNSYEKVYARLRDEIGTSLLMLPGGINAALKINAEANKIIMSLMTEFSDYKILTTILNRVSEIRKTFVGLLENEIKLLEDEIDKKPKAAKCWDNNKQAMRTLVGNAVKEGVKAVNTNLGTLDGKIKTIVKNVDDTISKIRKDVEACGFNADCINKYVKSFSH